MIDDCDIWSRRIIVKWETRHRFLCKSVAERRVKYPVGSVAKASGTVREEQTSGQVAKWTGRIGISQRRRKPRQSTHWPIRSRIQVEKQSIRHLKNHRVHSQWLLRNLGNSIIALVMKCLVMLERSCREFLSSFFIKFLQPPCLLCPFCTHLLSPPYLLMMMALHAFRHYLLRACPT